MKALEAADLFCGAGGSSTGLLQTCERAGRPVNLLAINHWETAVQTHELNHPGVRHMHEDLGAIDPRTAIPGGKLDILIASPECTTHSFARGNRPISGQGRSSAWHPLRWADQLKIDNLLIENVPRFRSWGPTDRRGRPIKSREGETYRQYLSMIESMGYTVEARVLNAADFGGATTRKRLFIIGVKGARRQIVWPEATHGPVGNVLGLKPWRAAREVIDWTLPGESIFTRKRRLAPATIERILIGLKRFGGKSLEPYLGVLRKHMNGRSLKAPLPTLTTSKAGEPYLVTVSHGLARHTNGRTRSVDQPLPTLTGANDHGVVQPCIIQVNHPRDKFRGQSVETPLPTITAKRGMALVEPFLIPHRTFSNMTADSVDNPLRTITANSSDFALVEPVIQDVGDAFLVPFFGEREGQTPRTHSVDSPLPTVTSHGAGGLIRPVIVKTSHSKGNGTYVRSADEPLYTISTEGGMALVEPYLVKYNRTGGARSTKDPLDTLTTKDRYGLVTGLGIKLKDGLYLDVRFRMLKHHELAAGMGFPEGYQFAGDVDDITKQIGNAVEVNCADALCTALLA